MRVDTGEQHRTRWRAFGGRVEVGESDAVRGERI